MSRFASKAVIVIGSGVSASLVEARLRATGPACLSVTVLGRGQFGQCHSLSETSGAVIAKLSDGRSIAADAAVLATGCATFRAHERSGFGTIKELPQDQGADADETVLIAGAGSRALRYALAAMQSGHRGPLFVVDRIGPVPALTCAGTLELSPADLPLGTGLRFALRWFRRIAGWAAANGFGTGDLVNGLRPHVPLIWQHLTSAERRRFVVHLRPLWLRASDRLTAEEHRTVDKFFQSSQLRFVRGRLLTTAKVGGSVVARLKHFPSGNIETVRAGLALSFEDAPPGRDQFAGTVVAGLLERGMARPDDFEYGLDVTEDCALISARGAASGRIFAVGAPTRGRFVDAMEIDCIRMQSERVAQSIFATITAT